jgi:hypothetical protein
MRRAAAVFGIGLLLAAATYAILWLGLGNIGLQQTVSIGPEVLLTTYLPTTALVAVLGVIVGGLVAALLRFDRVEALLLAATVVLVDVVMAVIVAPILIGEITLRHTPIVLAVLAVLGFQPLAIVIGALLALTAARRT